MALRGYAESEMEDPDGPGTQNPTRSPARMRPRRPAVATTRTARPAPVPIPPIGILPSSSENRTLARLDNHPTAPPGTCQTHTAESMNADPPRAPATTRHGDDTEAHVSTAEYKKTPQKK